MARAASLARPVARPFTPPRETASIGRSLVMAARPVHVSFRRQRLLATARAGLVQDSPSFSSGPRFSNGSERSWLATQGFVTTACLRGCSRRGVPPAPLPATAPPRPSRRLPARISWSAPSECRGGPRSPARSVGGQPRVLPPPDGPPAVPVGSCGAEGQRGRGRPRRRERAPTRDRRLRSIRASRRGWRRSRRGCSPRPAAPRPRSSRAGGASASARR